MSLEHPTGNKQTIAAFVALIKLLLGVHCEGCAGNVFSSNRNTKAVPCFVPVLSDTKCDHVYISLITHSI